MSHSDGLGQSFEDAGDAFALSISAGFLSAWRRRCGA
jgi:hypothetical protein